MKHTKHSAPQTRVSTDGLVTADKVAEALGIARRSVYGLAARGEIPSVRVGRKAIRFDPAAVAEAVAA